MFKSFLAATVVLAASQTVNAVEFINKDGSSLSDTCIAAAQAGKAAKNAGNVHCNGMPIREFAKQFQTKGDVAKVVVFENVNNAPETQVCIAAATSNEAFEQTVSQLDINTNDVKCNGAKLTKFAKRYNKQFKS